MWYCVSCFILGFCMKFNNLVDKIHSMESHFYKRGVGNVDAILPERKIIIEGKRKPVCYT
jgi:hypothetical protein